MTFNTELWNGAAPVPAPTEPRSLRFNSADSAYLSRTPASAGNRRTWTWAGWVKRSALGRDSIFSGDNVTGGGDNIEFSSNEEIRVYWNGQLNGDAITLAKFRDFSAWYHIAVAVDTTQATDTNRVKVYVNGIQQTLTAGPNGGTYGTFPAQDYDTEINTATPQWISRGGNNYSNFYLADVHFIDGQALDPTSFGEFDATTGVWNPIEYTGTYGTNGFHLDFSDNSSAAALGDDTSGNGNNWTVNNLSIGTDANFVTGSLSYRDSSTAGRNWDQSSFSSSTSNAIGPDDIWWVDLGQVRTFNEVTFDVVASGQGADTSTNFIVHFSSSSSSLGSNICGGGCTIISAGQPSGSTPGTISVTFDGFSAQVGRYIGISNGSGGQGGTYTYSNLAVIGDDSENNDSLRDHPTNGDTANDTGLGGEVEGNYCTWNPLKQVTNITSDVSSFTNGNLDATSSNSAITGALGTIGVSSGKWYWEITCGALTGGTGLQIGISKTGNVAGGNGIGTSSDAYVYEDSGRKANNNSFSSYGATFTNGDVIGVALDLDAGTIVFYKNGSSQGTAYSSLSGTFFPCFSDYNNSGTSSCVLNAGQRPFAYQAPSGFKPLATPFLPTPAIADGSDYMDVKLWTGNGTSQTISGLEFSPDFIWIKRRNVSNSQHQLTDTVRGIDKYVFSNLTNAEQTRNDQVTAVSSTGFTVGSNTAVNGNLDTHVAWTWDAGSSTVSNTDGSITSQVRANASAGFSIVTWTGNSSAATVGHGLGAAPSLIILKNRSFSAGTNWQVYHTSIGNTKSINLNTTGTPNTDIGWWNNTSPTSTVFSIGSYNSASGNTFVAYCFAPIEGYSAMGSFVGTGSATNSPFIWTGFRPQWILVKNISIVGTNWRIVDAARNTYNEANLLLNPNSGNSEQTTTANQFDILSNGFKLRGTDNDTNGSGETLIYYAVAENPFSIARAR